MRKTFSESGFEDYLYWQTHDKKILKRINDLLKDIERNGALKGIGKPERLKGNLQGYFSRRIDEKNRLVYKVFENTIEIYQCKEHYWKISAKVEIFLFEGKIFCDKIYMRWEKWLRLKKSKKLLQKLLLNTI